MGRAEQLVAFLNLGAKAPLASHEYLCASVFLSVWESITVLLSGVLGQMEGTQGCNVLSLAPKEQPSAEQGSTPLSQISRRTA